MGETDLLNKIADLMRERDALIDEKVKLVEKCQHKTNTMRKVHEAVHWNASRSAIKKYIEDRGGLDE